MHASDACRSIPEGRPQRKTPRFACDHCPRHFTRPSHLERHRLTHLPSDCRQSLPCSRCNKAFGRYDVLLRHMRSAHQVAPLAKQTAQRSCNRCVQKRRKCDREQPCGSCSASGVACEYPNVPARTTAPAPAPAADASSETLGRSPSDPLNSSLTTPESTITRSSFAGDHFYSSSYAELSIGMMGHTAPSSSFVPSTGTHSPPFSDGGFYMPPETPFVASLSAAGQMDFRTSGLDWLDFEVPDPAYFAVPELTPVPPPPLPPPPPLRPQSSILNLTLRPAVLPWPFDQPQDPIPHKRSLPPLREVLQSTFQSCSPGPTTTNPTISGLVALMSETYLPRPDAILAPNVAHAASLLKRLVDVYTTRFHPILPLLHVPTWSMSTFPTVLVAAMACIGGLLSDDEQAAELSWSLSEICLSMITWMGASDSANYRDISYLGALCLHQIYSLGSGSRQLYQNADRSRGILVASLRGAGCLTTRFSSPDDALPDGGLDRETDAGALRDAWLAWIARERAKRTAWSSFEYDCSLSTLTNRRGAVDLSELPSRLPSSEALWEAPTAQAWAALQARAVVDGSVDSNSDDSDDSNGDEHRAAFGPPVSAVLQAALSEKALPRHVSFWGKRLCAQVIGRLLWDLKQIELLSTAEYFGMPSLSTAQDANKVRLLRSLDWLLAYMDQPKSTADLISYNIASLICHYSHLYTARDMLDVVLYIVRNTVSDGDRLDRGIHMAQHRLQSMLARDPQDTRRLLWHAAQIIVVANDYLVSVPCEIMRLFMGYTFIIAYAHYVPRSPNSLEARPAVRLDRPSHQASGDAGLVNEWIARGGPASIGSAANIFAEGAALAVCRDAQQMLQRLRCWGLADKFTKILQSFETTVLENS